jgi:nucleotide-binding universal stress UspA family protein
LDRKQFQHAFVATDFSAGSADALTRAARLPLARGGRITVAHVLSAALPSKARRPIEDAARGRLDEACAALSEAISSAGRGDIEIAPVLCRGRPYVDIIRHARSAGADLIVLGRHGHRPVKDMFIGSTAERVIRVGDLPVLVVNRKATRTYRRPVLAVDIEATSRSVVDVAWHVLGPEVTSVGMLHACRLPFEEVAMPTASPRDLAVARKECQQTAVLDVARFQQSLGETGVRWETSIVYGEPRTAILAEALRRRADLLVLGTHGRKGLSHVLLGSVAEWVIRAAACDVLIARSARVTFRLP